MLEENFVNKSKIRFQSMITAKKMPIINKTAVSYSTSHSKSCQEIQEDTSMKKRSKKYPLCLNKTKEPTVQQQQQLKHTQHRRKNGKKKNNVKNFFIK